MFTLLTDFLTQEQQAAILTDAIGRRGKGLIAPEPFLQLPLDTMIQSVIAKVMGYRNSYAEARLTKLGVSIPVSIWCDRLTELTIFLRGRARDIFDFEEALLQKYPLISQDELDVQTGGLKLGYWHLFAKVELIQGIKEETLWDVASFLKPFLKGTSNQNQEDTPSTFSDELNNYIHAKQRRARGQKSVCAITGQPTSPLSEIGSPYKVQGYSNRRRLGATALVSQVSPRWQQELALRVALHGKDEAHEKVWIYRDSAQSAKDLIGFMSPVHAIRTACEATLDGVRVLVSPSVVPYAIAKSYEVEIFPDWLIHFDCKPSGDIQDATRILDVLKIFGRLHNVKPLGNYEVSVVRHGRRAMCDPLYMCDVLPRTTANTQYIQSALSTLGVLSF